jgi:hypothetical protein
MGSSWRNMKTGEALYLFQTAAIQARGQEERNAVEIAHEAHFRARWQDGSWEEADRTRAEMERLLARPAPVVVIESHLVATIEEDERLAAE